MITEELLSEVLEFKLEQLDFARLSKDNKEIEFAFKLSEGINIKNVFHIDFHINIYELAHKCKEWALSKGYSLYVKIRPDIIDILDVTHFYAVQIGTGSDKNAMQFRENTEPEAIFKACEWILNNK